MEAQGPALEGAGVGADGRLPHPLLAEVSAEDAPGAGCHFDERIQGRGGRDLRVGGEEAAPERVFLRAVEEYGVSIA